MKYLSDYMQDAQTKLFDQTGTFFAFSKKQFDEKAKPGVTYCDAGGGMICPKGQAKTLFEGLDRIYRDGIKQDVEENGIEAIVIREIFNHECYYTGSPSVVIEKLEDYPVTGEEIRRIFSEN